MVNIRQEYMQDFSVGSSHFPHPFTKPIFVLVGILGKCGYQRASVLALLYWNRLQSFVFLSPQTGGCRLCVLCVSFKWGSVLSKLRTYLLHTLNLPLTNLVFCQFVPICATCQWVITLCTPSPKLLFLLALSAEHILSFLACWLVRWRKMTSWRSYMYKFSDVTNHFYPSFSCYHY